MQLPDIEILKLSLIDHFFTRTFKSSTDMPLPERLFVTVIFECMTFRIPKVSF